MGGAALLRPRSQRPRDQRPEPPPRLKRSDLTFDGRPFDRDVRGIVYERAKGTDAEEPFGTERDVYRPGHEFL
ncbi:hypothetical protein GTY41_43980, partial [Streptomyces sp. SID685]|nr:hypothetical protein [Streptomyces sp. SID685]